MLLPFRIITHSHKTVTANVFFIFLHNKFYGVFSFIFFSFDSGKGIDTIKKKKTKWVDLQERMITAPIWNPLLFIHYTLSNKAFIPFGIPISSFVYIIS